MTEPVDLVHLLLVGAAACALVLAFGPALIGLLKRSGAGQRVRDDGPQRHLQKEGTPTMGGVLILGGAAVAALVGGIWSREGISLGLIYLLAVTAAFGSIGAADDWMKIARGRSLGLKARQKLLFQFLVSAVFAYALSGHRAVEAAATGDTSQYAGGLLTCLFWVVALTATSNAVNLSDGLDGLAAGLCTIASAGFFVLAIAAGNQPAALVAVALLGGCLGFLFYNRHPAGIFMGDVGSLALGGGLAALAAWLDQPLALLGLCLVPFIEAGSVIIQVISFKTTGKRVFRMSPIHHHFELGGWRETRVVLTFWAVALAAAILVLGLSLRG